MPTRAFSAAVTAFVALVIALPQRGAAAPAHVQCDAATRRVVVHDDPWPGSVTVEADYPDPCWELISATITWQSPIEATAEFVVRDVHELTPGCPAVIVTHSAEVALDPVGQGCGNTMVIHETILEANGSVRSQAVCSIYFSYGPVTGIPNVGECSATSPGGIVMACPSGDGPSLAERETPVTVVVRQCGTPIQNFPYQDVWLKSKTYGAVVLCQGGLVGDGNSGPDGVITISGRISGGGWEATAMQAVVAGVALNGPGMAIRVNSPDITGDLRVDLADVALFSADLVAQAGFRSDFYPNGIVNLADVGLFSTHLGHVCD